MSSAVEKKVVQTVQSDASTPLPSATVAHPLQIHMSEGQMQVAASTAHDG